MKTLVSIADSAISQMNDYYRKNRRAIYELYDEPLSTETDPELASHVENFQHFIKDVEKAKDFLQQVRKLTLLLQQVEKYCDVEKLRQKISTAQKIYLTNL